MSNIRWCIETLVLGSFLGSLLLALTKNLHPELTGLINHESGFCPGFRLSRVLKNQNP
jgi:hypothetical protein